MGGCATKPTKLHQAAAADENENEEERPGVVEVVKKVETKEIEGGGGRKSLSLLFMENKKENTKDDINEAAKFGVSLQQKPIQIVGDELKLPEACLDQKNAAT